MYAKQISEMMQDLCLVTAGHS